jgi:hypothetical protein
MDYLPKPLEEETQGNHTVLINFFTLTLIGIHGTFHCQHKKIGAFMACPKAKTFWSDDIYSMID